MFMKLKVQCETYLSVIVTGLPEAPTHLKRTEQSVDWLGTVNSEPLRSIKLKPIIFPT